MAKVRLGLDLIEEKWPNKLRGLNVGLLLNFSSFNSKFRWALDVFRKCKKFRLKAIFGPQHGIWGETQENMIEWEGSFEKKFHIPIFSLYGKTRKPTKEMLRDIDVFVFDLQDVGARYYTYIWTMDLCMEACKEEGKAFVILDRPNPINGEITEGPILKEDYASFVGRKPLPVRHGMTVGEIGFYFKQIYYESLDFHVIKMEGYRRSMWFDDTGLFWPFPSPNMPSLETAIFYPGMCLFEGTNISEGRGTTRPFEIFGAPFIEPEKLKRRLRYFDLKGIALRPIFFKPTFHKYKDELCGGFMMPITNRKVFKPFKTAIAIIKAIKELYPKEFEWRKPPYEYEFEKLPIDILCGTDRIRKEIEKGRDIEEMEEWWEEECRDFEKIRKEFFLYR